VDNDILVQNILISIVFLSLVMYKYNFHFNSYQND